MIHQFNTIEEIIRFIANMDTDVLKQMGLIITKTNGEIITPLSMDHLPPELQAKLKDLEDRLKLKVQITNTPPDPSHVFNFLAKDTMGDEHVYEFPQIWTSAEKTQLVEQVGKNAEEMRKIVTTVESLGGSVPSSVMTDVANLKRDIQDCIRIAPGNGSGNYQLLVMDADRAVHATTDFDYQVLQTMMNREQDQGDTITWLMTRPMDLGVITGTAANDLSGAPTERMPKRPLIEGDTISLKYPKGPSEPGKHYIQDFVWLDGIWQPKHI